MIVDCVFRYTLYFIKHTRCYGVWKNSACFGPSLARLSAVFDDCNNVRGFLGVYDFCVDNGFASYVYVCMVWFGSVWCGEAKIYVLMSFPDIKFFPLKKKTRAGQIHFETSLQATAAAHTLYLHVKYYLNSPLSREKKTH